MTRAKEHPPPGGRCVVGGVKICVPMGEFEEGAYVGQHVDARLTHEQGKVLKKMLAALHARSAQLNSGRYVQNICDVLRWLCEEIARQCRDSGRQCRDSGKANGER